MDRDLRQKTRQGSPEEAETAKTRAGLNKRIFIWEYCNNVTEAYHTGGGVMIIADDLETARKNWIEEEKLEDCELLTDDPDETYELNGRPENKIIIFPDAGCC